MGKQKQNIKERKNLIIDKKNNFYVIRRNDDAK